MQKSTSSGLFLRTLRVWDNYCRTRVRKVVFHGEFQSFGERVKYDGRKGGWFETHLHFWFESYFPLWMPNNEKIKIFTQPESWNSDNAWKRVLFSRFSIDIELSIWEVLWFRSLAVSLKSHWKLWGNRIVMVIFSVFVF